MATIEEMWAALAQLEITVALMVPIAAVTATAPPVVPAAAAPPIVLNVDQRINQSSNELVQLPRQKFTVRRNRENRTANLPMTELIRQFCGSASAACPNYGCATVPNVGKYWSCRPCYPLTVQNYCCFVTDFTQPAAALNRIVRCP